MLAEFASTAKETLSVRPDNTAPAALHLYASGTDSQSPFTFTSLGPGSPREIEAGDSILLTGPGDHNISYTFDIDLSSATLQYVEEIKIRILATDSGSPSFRHIIGERVIPQDEFYDGGTLTTSISDVVFGNVGNYEDAKLWVRIIKTDSSQDAGTITMSNIAWEESNTTVAVNAQGIFKRVNSAVYIALGSGGSTSSSGGGSGSVVNWTEVNNKPFETIGNGLSVSSEELSVNLGDFNTGDLAEGSNLYFTDERVDDRVNTLIQDGSNIS